MEKLIEYEKKLAEAVQGWGEDAPFVFRGHANEEWELDSGADRRLRQQETQPGLIEYLEKSLLEPARHEGHGRQQNKELNDLELLATLQHNGAATCLIDFTTNFHIALWFACREEDKKEGKVFVVNRSDIHTFEEVTPERATKGIKELLQGGQSIQPDLVGKQQKVYYWKPPPNENRIITQHSCFLFSLHPIEKEAYKEIIISKEHKKDIQDSLQRYYDLEEQAIFRDFTGFARSQSQSQPLRYKTSAQWFQSGNRYFQRGEFKAAITDFDTAIDLNPQYANAYTHRGLAKISLRQYEAALTDFDAALRLSPQNAAAYAGRGVAKGSLDQYEAAIADFDEMLHFNPQDAFAYTHRGLAKVSLKQHEAAITDFDTAIDLNPQYADAYERRGVAKGSLGQYEAALADFEAALRLNPEDADAYYKRGFAKNYLGQYEAAIADFDTAIDLNPQDNTAYTHRGLAKGLLEQHEAAIADFDTAIGLNPQDNTAYGSRGVAKGQLEQHEAAIADFDTAIDLNPQDNTAYTYRGLAKGRLGQHEEARADFQRALELAMKQGNERAREAVQKLLNALPSSNSHEDKK